MIVDDKKNITTSNITTTELSKLGGVTSNIQTQLNKKLTITSTYGSSISLNTSVYNTINENYILRNYGIVQMCLSFYTKNLSGWKVYDLGTLESGCRPQFGVRFGQITERGKTIYISIYASGEVQMYIAGDQLTSNDLVQFNTTWIL